MLAYTEKYDWENPNFNSCPMRYIPRMGQRECSWQLECFIVNMLFSVNALQRGECKVLQIEMMKIDLDLNGHKEPSLPAMPSWGLTLHRNYRET